VYASIFWDALDEREMDLIASIPEDAAARLFDEVRLLTARERRLMWLMWDAPDGETVLKANAELSRVQSQVARTLAQIHQMGVNRERLEFERQRIEIDLAKLEAAQQAQSDGSDRAESNFLEAMAAFAEEAWGGGDG
jgi:hypothetical protein